MNELYTVSASLLRLRATPVMDAANVLATMPQGTAVTWLGDAGNGWWRVKASFGAQTQEGYASSQYLAPQATVAPSAPRALPPANRLMAQLEAQGAARRDSEAHRECLLGEASPPRRSAQGATADRCAQLWQIIDYLDVEHSLRYQPIRQIVNGTPRVVTTFCNIYAYDYCSLAGVYLPRVWWNGSALIRINTGEALTAQYGRTVHEVRANELYDWLAEWGAHFGWQRSLSVDQMQTQVNGGRVGGICAQRTDLSTAGHIVAVIPET